MNILFLTLAISMAIALVFLVAFIWATKKGQYDDLITPSHRILIDDFETKKNRKEKEDKVNG
ncbi:MAG TPA: cbb3-type cytochrome oxidase assembly protein CcoS [Thermodesulfobacteriota bacterium]|jgi:cbb3-type cytochrome oxidase maturation protein|nr:cbb3-type cytochrome oxidase assembly protein CcoS [Thermodesulfobacteriota bacterium]